MSAQQFMEMLFGKLPEFFKDETQLRSIWSAPDTRKKLLQGLAESGFGGEQLSEMQRIIEAEKSDLFDVLAYVAYASLLGGVLTLGLLSFRQMPVPAAIFRQPWVQRLHDSATGVPYGIALAGAAAIIYPHSVWAVLVGG